MNILRRAYLNHDPEYSRPKAAEAIGVARLTVQRWEHFLEGLPTGSCPEQRHQKKILELFGVPLSAWERASANRGKAA